MFQVHSSHFTPETEAGRALLPTLPLHDPCNMNSATTNVEQLGPHGSRNPRPCKEGSGSERMSTLFSNKVLTAESARRKWPETKGQILPGALFLPRVQEPDKISAQAAGSVPGR